MFHSARIEPPSPARGITFECEKFPLLFVPIQEFDWCSVHHLKAASQQHSVSMERDHHTFLIFDRGSYCDGWRSVDGVRRGQRGILGNGVDVIPAGSQLNAWSGLRSDVGCTLISVNPSRLSGILGDDECSQSFRPATNLRNELLIALASRISALGLKEPCERDGLQGEMLLMLLVQEMSRLQQNARFGYAHRGGLAPRVEQRLREFVNENMGTNIDLETMSNIASLSRFHFCRAFKTTFNLSPHKYVQQERLRRACELMEHTDNSITDIALQVGFASSSELSRTFKQSKGCSPREYRGALSHPAVMGRPVH